MAIPTRLDPLTRAAIRSGSDKFGGHLYTPTYHALFASRREEPLKLLEIGIGGYDHQRAGGLGLRMWADYFPFASVVGLDIHRKTLGLPPRVSVVQGSQDDVELLHRLSQQHGPFDIVIDDGSHLVPHMLASFLALYPLMAADGIYAVEDTQTSFTPMCGGQADGAGTIFELAHKVGLAMHRQEGYVPSAPDEAIARIAAMTHCVSVYRNIIVFQRGTNTYPSNGALRFDNPEVQAVYNAIALQAARVESPTGCLSRIDMLIWGGKHEDAEALAMEAADAYPRDLTLLFELQRMMQWAQRGAASARMAALIEQRLADD